MGARKSSSRAAGAIERGDGALNDVDGIVGVVGPEATGGAARIGFAPIVRVDAPRREIELCATSEAVDSHGTIVDYDASKEAFTRWIGNVREMHGRQAVGSRVAVRCDDEGRRIYVRIRISRGAQDTWEKVLDGTLRGASFGASDVVWRQQRRRVAGEQRMLNVATRYDLVELSLVDNPSNPDALGVTFVRDATPDLALLAELDEIAELDEAERLDGPDAPVTRAPADEPRVIASAREGRSDVATCVRLHGTAQAVLTGCGCPACAAAWALLDQTAPVERAAQDDDQPMARALAAGLSENAAGLVAFDAGVRALAATVDAALRRVGNEVGALGSRMVALESQPQCGGPVARPMEKPSALAARGLMETPSATEQYRALESLAGRLRDPQAQLAVAAELIRLRQEG